MSVFALAWAWRQYGLAPSQKLTLLAMADQADDAGGLVCGIRWVAAKTELSERQVRRVINELIGSGRVTVSRRGGDGAGRLCNRYRLDVADKLDMGETGTKEQKDILADCHGQKDILSGSNRSPCPVAYKEEDNVKNTKVKNTPLPPAELNVRGDVLPEYIQPGLWEMFLQSRRQMMRPVLTSEYGLLFERLDDLRKQGNDPAETMKQSIRNHWKDFYAVKKTTMQHISSHIEKVRGNTTPASAKSWTATREKPLPSLWAKMLFAKMKAIYGTEWSRRFSSDTDIDLAMEAWAEGLAGMTGEQIAAGLSSCRKDHKWAPSSPAEFRERAGVTGTHPSHRIYSLGYTQKCATWGAMRRALAEMQISLGRVIRPSRWALVHGEVRRV